MKTQLLLITILFFCAQNLHAYSSTMMSGDILERDNYLVTADLQYLTEEDFDGFILNGRFDMPFSEDVNFRGVLGFGEVDFHLGGFVKWMPIPDYGHQPAVGILAGLQYASLGEFNEYSIRISPYISKSFNFGVGRVSPYASLPISFRIIDGESEVPVQFQLGGELKIRQLQHIAFIAEFGVNVSESFTYFSLGATLHFDSHNGVVFH